MRIAASALIAFAIATPAVAQTVPDETPAPQSGLTLALFDLDTPIGTLIADERARAVLDKHLPGLSTDENLDKFKQMSLREFQPYTGGKLTDAMLEQVGKDLRAIH
ncbi:hypothetical protein KY084_13290 [Stakelama sp. CBK3Z-3]|uniref:Uncharacterized protein n=1 Tax=Stakelama flava TaxID=2860338 RepID=A0ABS6XNP7_9SPHN|nr:hypothetical protein [Stakelama flava]